MMLFRHACSAVPAACSTSALAAVANASSKLVSITMAYSSGPTRGRTAGEMGDDTSKSFRSAEDKATGAGSKVEPKVSDAGFVPEGDAVLSPDSAGRAGGIGSDIMGDMMDMMNAAVKGDDKRAAADVADMARHQSSDANTSSHTKPPHTTCQDWPRGSITDPKASPAASQPGAGSVGEAPFVNADESQASGIDRYEGTIPRVDPSEELPEVDQNPPESVTAGPTPGYAARGATHALSDAVEQ